MSQSFQPDPWQTGPDVESKLQDWRFKKYDEQFQYLASLPVEERMQIIQEHMSPGGRWRNELNNLLPGPDSRVAYKGMHAPTDYFPLNALGHIIASNKFDPYGQAYEAGEGLPDGYRHRETGELLANGFLPEDESSHMAVLSGIQDYKTGNPQLTKLNANSNGVLVGHVEKGSSFPTTASFDSDGPVLEGKVEYKKRWPSWEKVADAFKYGSDVLGPSLGDFLQANAQRAQARKRQEQEQADEAVSQVLNRKRSGHYEEGNKVPETQLKHIPLMQPRNPVGSQLPELPGKNNNNLPFRSLDREGSIPGPKPVAGFEDPRDYVGNLDNAMPQYKPFASNNFAANERLRNPDEIQKLMQVQQQQQRLAQSFPANSQYVRRPRDYSLFSSRGDMTKRANTQPVDYRQEVEDKFLKEQVGMLKSYLLKDATGKTKGQITPELYPQMNMYIANFLVKEKAFYRIISSKFDLFNAKGEGTGNRITWYQIPDIVDFIAKNTDTDEEFRLQLWFLFGTNVSSPLNQFISRENVGLPKQYHNYTSNTYIPEENFHHYLGGVTGDLNNSHVYNNFLGSYLSEFPEATWKRFGKEKGINWPWIKYNEGDLNLFHAGEKHRDDFLKKGRFTVGNNIRRMIGVQTFDDE